MKSFTLLLFLITIHCCLGQTSSARLLQYYSVKRSVCEYNKKKQKIDSIWKENNQWNFKALVTDRCITRLYPNHKIVSDTLKIKMLEITEYNIRLENGDEFEEILPEYDCACIYEVGFEFYLDNIEYVEINGMVKKLSEVN